jgi:hypothetical protein
MMKTPVPPPLGAAPLREFAVDTERHKCTRVLRGTVILSSDAVHRSEGPFSLLVGNGTPARPTPRRISRRTGVGRTTGVLRAENRAQDDRAFGSRTKTQHRRY